jgi:hypothetical protein
LLILSNFIVASAAVARDSKDALRDNLAFCGRFVIHDPDPSVVVNNMLIAVHERGQNSGQDDI